ncbi:DNA translocase FtsK [Fluviibacterium sp. S390]|uniref:DNA translocase FtsK n=1 Tax=Fluviibacterium sp. S390 TaxID=3415139 RepID=UPI003C7C94B8
MAFQTRSRDPLFDQATQAALERRATELLGLVLLAGAVVLALALGSYAPTDPSFLGTSDAPPQNWLGLFGAYLASPLNVVLGKGSWSIPLVLGLWGGRFLLHQGEDRALSRTIFVPILVAAASVYAATMPPGAGWVHSFGLGGLFGDTVLGVLMGLWPASLSSGLMTFSAALGLLLVGLGLFACGFTRTELKSLGRFMWFGLLYSFDRLVNGLGRGAERTRDGVVSRRARRAEARAARKAAVEDDEDFDLLDEDDEDEAPSPSILPNVPSLGLLARTIGRDQPRLCTEPVDDLIEDPDAAELFDDEDDEDAPVDHARVQAKITDAIRTRLRSDRARVAAESRTRQEPILTRPEPEDQVGSLPSEAEDEDYGFDADIEAFEDLPDIAPAPMPGPAPIPRVEAPKAVVQHADVRRPALSTRAKAEAEPPLQFDEAPAADYAPPPLSLLRDPGTVERHYLSDEALEENARMLENVLEDYGVKGDIVSVRPGPVVTMYELEPAPGLKASRVIGLSDDIARSMSALSARVSTVPGRTVIGIELPNDKREMVLLREILSARDFGDSKLRLPLALGKDIGGESVVANLSKMPHLLIAGTTGSGKSVAINTMILSLLYKLTPDECRLIMIDPKMLELSVYDGIPHLLSPVVTDPKKAVVALKWVVAEMEDRYRKMSKMGVRNIEGYNGKVRATLAKNEMFTRTVQTGFDDETGDPVFETEEFEPKTLPYIVVIVDEMADLMMVAGKEIEACIQRLAQMARASGIHLIMATQRPSVDVITGTIKANFPTRISFQVTSKVDSRTILGEQGAEQLLGMGDMLYMAGGAKITRAHGPFVSDEEVEDVVNHLKTFGPPDYVGGVADGPDDERAEDIDAVLGLNTGGNTGGEDALYDQAVQIVIQDRKCSTSYIQRKLSIGYNKAARLVEQMEDNGLVSPANHVGKRDVLVPEQN